MALPPSDPMAKSQTPEFDRVLRYVRENMTTGAGEIVAGPNPAFSFVVDLDGRKYRIRCGPLTERQLSMLHKQIPTDAQLSESL